MSKRRYTLVLFAGLLLAWMVPRSAAADDPPKVAAQHFQNGLRFAREGDLDRAASEFEAAYRLSPHPSVLYNLGQTYASLGRPVEAVRVLKSYLQGAPDVPRTRREEVEALIGFHEKRIGKLVLSVVPATEVLIDGRSVAASEIAQPIDVGAGVHLVAAKKPGYLPVIANAVVRPGESSTLELKLELLPADTRPRWVSVSCPIDDVNVRLDGKLVGKTPLASPVAVQVGSHQVSFDRPGYAPSQQIVEAATTTMDCKLKPSPTLASQTAARLEVASSTPRTTTFIDGARYGGGLLPPGKHALSVESPGYHPIRQVVQLHPGRTTRLDLDLAPTPETRRSLANEASDRQRLYSYIGGAAGLLLCGTAATLYAVNSGRHDDYEKDGQDLSRRLANGTATAEDAGELNSQAASIQRLDDLALVSGIAGLALLGTSVGLFVTAGSPAATDEGPQSAMVTVSGALW